MDGLANEAVEAGNKMEQSTLYRITKEICGKNRAAPNIPVKDKQGNMLTSESDQEKRWTEHFGEVLNRPPPQQEPNIPEAEMDININTEPPDIQEIISVIKSLKNWKAPGSDNLNAELFKADNTTTATILQPIFKDMWIDSAIPKVWNKGTIIKLPKKGALSDCNNWRGITLLSISSKIMAKIIIK